MRTRSPVSLRRPALDRWLAGLLAAGLLAACSAADDRQVPEGQTQARPDIAPPDFVLLPCSAGTRRACTIVLAGGKTLMFGAPAGAGQQARAEDLSNLEALFLFSMHPEDIEGVDEVRNRGWREGRRAPLPLTGPDGTAALVEGLNLAFEQPDAISFVEDGAPRGGFAAALLSLGTDVTGPALVYDSGDLKVRAWPGGGSALGYRIEYRDIDEVWHDVVLAPCAISARPDAPSGKGTPPHLSPPDLLVTCAQEPAGGDYSWPLEKPVFAVKSDR